MLLKNIAQLCTNQQCVPNLGNSDLAQFPPITGEQRKAESSTVTCPVVEMRPDPAYQNSSHPIIDWWCLISLPTAKRWVAAWRKKSWGKIQEEVGRAGHWGRDLAVMWMGNLRSYWEGRFPFTHGPKKEMTCLRSQGLSWPRERSSPHLCLSACILYMTPCSSPARTSLLVFKI